MQAGIKRYHAELMLILATMIWGGTFSALKMGLEHTSPFYLVALRFLIASILFGLYFPMKKELPTWDGFPGIRYIQIRFYITKADLLEYISARSYCTCI